MKVSPEIEKAWLTWQQKEHIPEVMSSGCFTEYKFFRLLDVDESDGPTYVVQYFSSSRELYQQYIDTNASALRKKSFEKWGDKFIAFRSLMQVVN